MKQLATEGIPMTFIHTQYFNTPYGELKLGSYDQQLCLCDWSNRKTRRTIDKRITKGLAADYIEKPCPVLDLTKQQLGEYFNRERKVFDIPLLTVGTPFQKEVWTSLSQVPFGTKVNYSNLARSVNSGNAVRAVANANGANAISIIIPCHRVIGSDGTLTGYAGGIDAKKRLLDLECDIEASDEYNLALSQAV